MWTLILFEASYFKKPSLPGSYRIRSDKFHRLGYLLIIYKKL